MSKTFSISELAGEFGITPRTIRFYEDQGLIQPRRNGLNRIYTRRDRGRLQLILRGKRLGFSLKDIGEMLDLYDVGDGQVEQLRTTWKKSRARIETLATQRRDIDQAVEELEEACATIERMLAEKGVIVHEL